MPPDFLSIFIIGALVIVVGSLGYLIGGKVLTVLGGVFGLSGGFFLVERYSDEISEFEVATNGGWVLGGHVAGVLGGIVCPIIFLIVNKDEDFIILVVELFLFLILYALVFAVSGAICGGIGGITGGVVGLLSRHDIAARISGALVGTILGIAIPFSLRDSDLPPYAKATAALLLACGGCVGGFCANLEGRYGEKRKIDVPSAPVAPPPMSSAPTTPRWYYSRDGQTAGPVTVDEVRRLVASGQLQPTDFLLQEGTQTWVPVCAVPALTTTK